MSRRIENLVFEGGGVLGIAYLGVLHYLYENSLMANITHVAGTSAGAICACLTSLNLPFTELKKIADTLEYRKVPLKDEDYEIPFLPDFIDRELDRYRDDFDCIVRLLKRYGWYSSEYFYHWIKEKIESQFDHSKKAPPYTFADFHNPGLHLGGRPFFDLSVIGTDISYRDARIFSYATTPLMEVATAVRISMSIPLFFESIPGTERGMTNLYADGGVLRNYPINLYDQNGVPNPATLGARFKVPEAYRSIDSLIEFIINLFMTFQRVQQINYETTPADIIRSIEIDTGDVSFVNFGIVTGDSTYQYLYHQGYEAARTYFRRN